MASVWPSIQCEGSPITISQHQIPHNVGHPEGTLKYPKYHNAPLLESDELLENGSALTCCVAVGKYLNLSEPRILHL